VELNFLKDFRVGLSKDNIVLKNVIKNLKHKDMNLLKNLFSRGTNSALGLIGFPNFNQTKSEKKEMKKQFEEIGQELKETIDNSGIIEEIEQLTKELEEYRKNSC
jgi:uncharacterized membrane-anchored protein